MRFLIFACKNFLHRPCLYQKFHFLIVLSTIFFSQQLYAQQEDRSSREALVATFNKKFFQSNRTKQYLAFGGYYGSDYNSKNYNLNSRYLIQNPKLYGEINFQHRVNYVDSGSGKNRQFKVKKMEEYDLSSFAKFKILRTDFYSNFYHRSIYDKFSNYFYDQRSAIGLGRSFMRDKIEADFSLTYRDVKNYSYEVDYLGSLRILHKFNNKLSINLRSYIFYGKNLLDEEYRSSLVYRINNEVSLELRHNYEKRRFTDFAKKTAVNQISRVVSFGLVFDLF